MRLGAKKILPSHLAPSRVCLLLAVLSAGRLSSNSRLFTFPRQPIPVQGRAVSGDLAGSIVSVALSLHATYLFDCVRPAFSGIPFPVVSGLSSPIEIGAITSTASKALLQYQKNGFLATLLP